MITVVNSCLCAHLVEVERWRLEPYDSDVVLVIPEEVREETEEDGSYFLIHQLLGASLLDVLRVRGGGTREHVVTTVNLRVAQRK